MATISSFHGYRYNPSFIKNIENVLVPPYDIISPNDQKSFKQIHPNNMIHLTLSKPVGYSKPYSNVNNRLQSWIRKNLLIRDNNPSIYFYTMEFKINPDITIVNKNPKGKFKLSGFISLVKLEEFKTKGILPHEVTFPTPRLDRLKLLESCQAHLEPVYALYNDKKNIIVNAIQEEIFSKQPDYRVTDINKTLHTFWSLCNPELVQHVQKLLSKKILLIADGHHRYEASLNYKNKLQTSIKNFPSDHPANYIMMFLVNMNEEGLVVYPTHRMIRNLKISSADHLLKNLSNYFYVEKIHGENSHQRQYQLKKLLSEESLSNHSFGLYDGNYYLLRLKEAKSKLKYKLDTEIFQNLIAQKTLAIPKQDAMDVHIGFTHSFPDAISKVDEKEYQYAFFLRPPGIHQVNKICANNIRLPQKSTYFFPKPLSGFVLYLLN